MTASIEAMARETGGYPPNSDRNFWEFLPPDLTRFAALVRAQALEDAARVCESLPLPKGPLLSQHAAREQLNCAAAIRALPPSEG